MKYIEGRLSSYVRQLERYIDYHQLPEDWFWVPDHLSVNAASSEDFDKTLDVYSHYAQHITWVEKEGRRLASVWLSGKLAVGDFGEISWVEVGEPPPELPSRHAIGLKRLDFYYPDFSHIKGFYAKKKNNVAVHIGPRYTHLNFGINVAAQEVGLANRPLSDVVGRELRSGEARIVRF